MDFDNELDETLADTDGAGDEEETPGMGENAADGEKEDGEDEEDLAEDEEV
ncbi:MAG: hypothetical protein HYT46_03590 [Candidatus Vogelbacteria bacterium]|nr:hypothetical protein [Candidatus Vogelbacteria bacterium]